MASSIKKLTKATKSMQKKLNNMYAQLAEQDEDSDEDSEDEQFFQVSSIVGKTPVQFAQVANANFEGNVQMLFNQAKSCPKDLELSEVFLLDSQSTVNLLCNAKLADSVYESDATLRLTSNGGKMCTNLKCTVKGYHQDPWFDPCAITNVIALTNMKKQYCVTYDSEANNGAFIVHRQDDGKQNMIFRHHPSGLHYWDPRDEASYVFVEKAEETALVTTVEENKSQFTKRQIKQAEVAKNLYATLCFPSWQDYKWIVRANMIANCPVTLNDINRAEAIWGKDVHALMGKQPKKKPTPVTRDIVKVPKEFMKLHNEVLLSIDIFFVNGIAFFLSLSRVIYYTGTSHLADRKVDTIYKAFKEMFAYYLRRGFRIVTVYADGEFEPLKPMIEALPAGPQVNLAAKGEHVADIERRIRVVKERARATRSRLPYRRIPQILTIWIVFGAVRMLNYFPSKGGVSSTLSPNTIMSGEVLDYKKQLQLPVGQYCQVHEEELPRNSQAPRTRGAIALGPTGNVQGGFRFMSLKTGKRITRYSWDSIPITETVIARVEQLGRDQPEHFIFTNRHGHMIGDVATPGVQPEYPDLLEPDTAKDPAAVDIPGVDNDVELTGVDPDTHTGDQGNEFQFDDPDTAVVPPPPVDAGPEPVVDDYPLPPPPDEPELQAPAPQPEPEEPSPPNLHRSTRVQ